MREGEADQLHPSQNVSAGVWQCGVLRRSPHAIRLPVPTLPLLLLLLTRRRMAERHRAPRRVFGCTQLQQIWPETRASAFTSGRAHWTMMKHRVVSPYLCRLHLTNTNYHGELYKPAGLARKSNNSPPSLRPPPSNPKPVPAIDTDRAARQLTPRASSNPPSPLLARSLAHPPSHPIFTHVHLSISPPLHTHPTSSSIRLHPMPNRR